MLDVQRLREHLVIAPSEPRTVVTVTRYSDDRTEFKVAHPDGVVNWMRFTADHADLVDPAINSFINRGDLVIEVAA